MASYVEITLDTTAPLLDGNLADQPGGSTTLTLSSDDATEVRIWGEIDATWPGNADFGESAGDADWIPFDTLFELRLVGAHQVFVQVRDDVWNESAVLGLVPGGVVPTQPGPQRAQPARPQGIPTQPQPRVVRSRSTVHVTSRGRVRQHRPGASPVRLRSVGRIASVRRRGEHAVVRSTGVVSTRSRGTSRLHPVGAGHVDKRSEGPGTEAAMIELDII